MLARALPCLALLALGCVGDPIGDPCIPESVPPGGFVAADTYVETSSPQCQTRLCVARGLEGDPRPDCAGERCASPDEVRARAYCTAACASDDGCPEGFRCEEVSQHGRLCLRP